jgi:protein TonB
VAKTGKGDAAPPVSAQESYQEPGGSISPAYPEECRENGEYGTVIVDVEILSSGQAGAVSLVKSSGYGRLDSHVMGAVRSSMFRPAMKNHKPVASRKRFIVNFNLED